ncbi:hypothetical protein SAE02_61640 [Skermanella aerolata]|uniref:Uncharacterized protein n=1 Tax=Skermanella aerolata TaxID=393310 RepID=A0A512DZW0_9PROT|nr:hypothetical protein [Skermanella aerolata]KJB91877.1 hypothetical protein N826_25510 [Skermanella aerolata KACC 11604]GEO42016.1 hypothetical protein SAE02_61640 [Skermanella aerolata]
MAPPGHGAGTALAGICERVFAERGLKSGNLSDRDGLVGDYPGKRFGDRPDYYVQEQFRGERDARVALGMAAQGFTVLGVVQAHTIRSAIEWLLEDGISKDDLAKHLNALVAMEHSWTRVQPEWRMVTIGGIDDIERHLEEGEPRST